MISKDPLATLAVTSIAVVAPATAQAGDSFARHVWPNINFLDQSSRLAATKSKNNKLRSFARSEAAEQTIIANALVAYLESKIAEQQAPPPPRERTAHQGSPIAAPFRAASHVSAGIADAIDGVQTGRSVAVDPAETGRHVRLEEIRLPQNDRNVERLAALSGKEFDELYKTLQNDALLQLSTSYASYIDEGSDVALKALAIRALPAINKRIAILKALE